MIKMSNPVLFTMGAYVLCLEVGGHQKFGLRETKLFKKIEIDHDK